MSKKQKNSNHTNGTQAYKATAKYVEHLNDEYTYCKCKACGCVLHWKEEKGYSEYFKYEKLDGVVCKGEYICNICKGNIEGMEGMKDSRQRDSDC